LRQRGGHPEPQARLSELVANRHPDLRIRPGPLRQDEPDLINSRSPRSSSGIEDPIRLSFPEGEYLKGLICRVW
jgi:hypothetical protein